MANMNGSTGAGCWTTGPGSSPEMEPPSYDLTATERALRRERIRRTADVSEPWLNNAHRAVGNTRVEGHSA